jgi:hypothetical protein
MSLFYNSEKVEVSDELDGLQCYHYRDCNDLENQTAEYRGIIADGSTILCKSFPFTPEFPLSKLEENKEAVQTLLDSEHAIFDSYEGTLLRLWRSPSEWRLSTHRKIDAFSSRWGSDSSYGEYFVQALSLTFGGTEDVFGNFTQNLNTDKVYLFLLRTSKENRVVCDKHEHVSLFSVGAFDRSSAFDYSFEAPETNLPYSATVKCAGIDEISTYVNQVDPFEKQGIVIITKDGKSLKIINDEYFRLNSVRGNNPSVLRRFIELRDTEMKNDLISLYPEFMGEINHFEDVFESVCNNIYKKYINRYVRKRVAILPPEQYNIMKEVHEEYVRTRTPISIKMVESILNRQSPRQLHYVFEQYKKRQVELGDGNLIPKEDADKLFAQVKSKV